MLASKRGQWLRGGWEVEEELRFLAVERFVFEDGDVAVWVEAVDEAGAWSGAEAQAAGACGDATVWLDQDAGALAEDVGPPRTFGRRTQGAAAFLFGEQPGGERSHGQFAVALVGVAMGAEFVEEGVGGCDGGDVLGGAEGGQAVLPVLMAALDFALGLRGGGVSEGDAVEVQGGAELGEGVWHRGEEEAVATRDARASPILRGAHAA